MRLDHLDRRPTRRVLMHTPREEVIRVGRNPSLHLDPATLGVEW